MALALWIQTLLEGDPMKIASFTTLLRSRKTRISYANSAMERDSLSGDPVQEERADKAFEASRNGKLEHSELMYYAEREKEFKELHD